MAEITKPSSPGWARVTPRYHKVRARSVSPFTLESQSYQYSGESWSFTFELPPLSATQAGAWKTFFYDLAKAPNYFTVDVSAYVPAGVTGTRSLRLTSPDATWDVGSARIHRFVFEAEDNI